MIVDRADLERRVLAKSIPCPASGCYLWTGNLKWSGYGRFSVGPRETRVLWDAHRASWVAFRGDIPAGLCVCHKCDTPACVNPDHLFLGTPADNCADMFAKGRETPPHLKANPGEKNGNAVLTETLVRTILAEGRGCRRIAATYGVALTTVKDVRSRRTWKHIQINPELSPHPPMPRRRLTTAAVTVPNATAAVPVSRFPTHGGELSGGYAGAPLERERVFPVTP